MPVFREYRFMLLRRISQTAIMGLFLGGNLLGWQVLQGNLSTSRLLHVMPLTDPFAVLQIFAARHMVATEALTGALIIMLFFGLIAGRSFCSWVCPLNMVTDAANWLREKAGLTVLGNGPVVISRRTRYGVIGISLAVSLATGIAAFEWISPIAMLHRGIIFGMGMGWTLVLAVFIFDLFVQRDGFCGHVCPLGGFYALITRFSLIRIQHDREKCSLCRKCLDICPEQQVLPMVGKSSSTVTSGACTNCGRCIEVCPDHAMKFGIRFSPGKQRTRIA
jgi:ferredoxin-type protein NapH